MQTGPYSSPSIAAYLPAVRELLAADRTYYIATSGSDSTGDGSSGNPWRYPQKAYDYICANLDLGGYTVTVQFADGNYNAAGDRLFPLTPWSGGGSIVFQGNTGNKNAAYWYPNGYKVVTGCVLPGPLTFQYFKVGGNGGLVQHWGVGLVFAQQINFSGGTADCFQTGAPGAVIDVIGDCEISGNYGSFCNSVSPGSYVYLDAYWVGAWTLTLTGTPNFTSAFAKAMTLGHVYISGSGITFSGSATGKRYDVIENSVIATEGLGATGLPGNASGTTATGGLYS